jgi:hypothetical protein
MELPIANFRNGRRVGILSASGNKKTENNAFVYSIMIFSFSPFVPSCLFGKEIAIDTCADNPSSERRGNSRKWQYMWSNGNWLMDDRTFPLDDALLPTGAILKYS